MARNTKVSVYDYSDYRAFLRDAFAAEKAQNKKFSFRYFSRIAGFKSQSVLKQVLDGQSNIAPASIERYAKAFGLSASESEFFYHLVMMNQAKTSDERVLHAKKMLANQQFRRLNPLSGSQLKYYKHWYYIPIREMVLLGDFNEDPRWIARRLRPRITPEQAGQALHDLIELGLLQRDSEGRLRQSEINVSTGDTVVSSLVVGYHKEMLSRALEAIDRFHRDQRDISSVTVAVTKEQMGIITAKVRQFRKEVLALIGEHNQGDRVVQLNLQLFPLTDSDDEGGGRAT